MAMALFRWSWTTAPIRNATPPSHEMAVVTGYPIALYGRGLSGSRRRSTKSAENEITYCSTKKNAAIAMT